MIRTYIRHKGDELELREYDGGRSVQIDAVGDFVILEAGEHAWAFDRAIFLHGVKRALGISVIMETEVS